MSNTSREYTVEEMQKQFIEAIYSDIEYWKNLEKYHSFEEPPTLDEKMEGLAHSILTLIDGFSMHGSGYALIPISTQEDIDYNIENGTNYRPQYEPDGVADLGGELRYLFKEYKPQSKE